MKKILRNKDTGTPIQRYLKSFMHALDGIRYAIVKEHNMIIILIAIVVTTILGIYFNITKTEWIICILLFGLVSATEMINTAIEATIDLITSSIHPLAKIAKDTASSATLIFSISALIIGLMIFIPYILEVL